jgi:hypothetical protein
VCDSDDFQGKNSHFPVMGSISCSERLLPIRPRYLPVLPGSPERPREVVNPALQIDTFVILCCHDD